MTYGSLPAHCGQFCWSSLFGSIGAQAAVVEELSPQPGQTAGDRHRQFQLSKHALFPHLANAGNDATRLSESLKRLNFDVLTGTDLSSNGFARLFQEADGKLAGASAVLIFYAGHGVQLQGENYLLPVDTPDAQNLAELTARAVRLNDVISRFASRERQTFIFLDACRNNPMGKGASAMDGLAQVEVGENTFVAFATQPGKRPSTGRATTAPSPRLC